MKKTILLGTTMAALALAQPAPAGEDTGSDRRDRTALGATTGMMIGAIAGGPIGAVAGIALGAYSGNTIARSQELPAVQGELDTARSELGDERLRVAQLNARLDAARGDLQQLSAQMTELLLERAVFDGLAMDVMYSTGESRLSPEAVARVERLAELLHELPELTVQLDGYADPRGEEGYNAELSGRRAEGVREVLIAAGVVPERISVEAHGETVSEAAEGNLDHYALERRVRISLDATQTRTATVQP